MAEGQSPVTHGELVEIVRRLDDRISNMDRRIDERFEAVTERISSLDRNLTETRTDIRMLTRFVMGFYAAMIAVVGLAFTLYKFFPNTPPTP